MALTRTQTIYKDTLLAHSGSTDLGGGNDEHLPIGMAGSYNCKAALKFNLDFAGVTKVISARLYLKTTTKVHALTWGASPTLIIERLDVGNFTENTGRSSYDSPAGSGWSTSASDFGSAQVQPGPNNINWTPGNNESTWYSVDITGIFNYWVPTSILLADGVTHGPAAANYGILIRPSANATSETIEFFSRKSGSDPYIVMTYESNTAPNAPTTPAPANGAVITGVSAPTFSWLYDDPQGDASSGYQLQASTDPTFATTLWDTGVVPLVQADNTTMSVVAGVSFTRGVTYYWRVATIDAAGLVSAWSSTWNFTINSLPVATLTEPSATGRIAKVRYDAGSGWTQPRLVIDWTYSDAQGQGQTQYEIDVRVDSAGSPGTVIVNTVVAGAATEHVVSQNIIENTRYHIRVRTYDGLEWSNWSGYFIVRARWGFTVHQKDVSIAAAPPTSWSVPVVNAPVDTATQAIAIEYNSGTNGTSGGLMSTWQPSLATVVKNNFVYYRVWFMAWGASPAPLPALLDLTIRTSGLTVQPERWLPNPLSTAGGSIEFSDRVFGTQCLRIDGPGPRRIYQQVPVEPDTNYVLQARIKSYGASSARTFLADTAVGAPLTVLVNGVATEVSTVAPAGDQPWLQQIAPVWNSGSRTSVFVILHVAGAAGTVGLFDGFKMERGRVTSPWTPGLVGTGVALDSGGVQIDATGGSGAIFRLRAAGGQIIQLGASALEWQGQSLLPAPWVATTAPAAPTDGQLWWDTGDASLEGDTTDKGTTFPVSPAVDRLYFRTDIGMQFRWDGSRWLSTTEYELAPLMLANVAASADSPDRLAVPWAHGGTGLWLTRFQLGGFNIGTGATALGPSHYWTLQAEVYNGTVYVLVGPTYVINSGGTGWRLGGGTTGAGEFLDPAPYMFVALHALKFGTPGNLYAYASLYYRVVAT